MTKSYLSNFLDYYQEIKEKLISKQDEINNGIVNNIENEHIRENIMELSISNRDGKYIRGTLINLGNYLFGNGADATYLAFAYELFETSILIHDDIIDEGKQRRHNKTIPYRICDKYEKYDALKYGNDIALCDGIYGYYYANNIILDYYKNNKYLMNILHLFNDIVLKTVEGEILDVTLPFKNINKIDYTKEDDVFEIYQKKTAWYTIIGPFLLGMMLNGKTADAKLESILMDIGVAFQIKDDLLGIYAENLGKSLTDVLEFKQTILYTHILNTEYKDEFLKYYGTDNNDIIKELFDKAGSKEYAENYLNDTYKSFLIKIDDIDIDENGKDILKGLMEFVIKREK